MNNDMTDKERYEKITEILNKIELLLKEADLLDSMSSVFASHTSMDFPKDLSCECDMCGKPMEYRYCGMCPRCEQVYNG